MFDLKVDKEKNEGVLTIDGDLGIMQAEELKNAFATILKDVDNINVNVEKVTYPHIACLQLFCSAHRTAINLNKKITLDSNHSEDFDRLVAEVGLINHPDTEEHPKNHCLWVKGGES